MKIFPKHFLLLIGLLCFSNQMIAQSKSYAFSHIPAELTKNADEVVRLNYKKFIINNPKSATLHVKQVITLLNSNSEEYLQVVGYNKYSKITSLSARIYDINGKEVRKIKAKEFSDQSSISSFSIYEDDRIKKIELRHNSFPYTVEFEYKVDYKKVPFYPPSYLQSYNRSVQDFEFIVETPADLEIRYKAMNTDLKPIIDQQSKKTVYTWKTNSLLALEYEPYAPYPQKIHPMIVISPTKFQYDKYEGDMSSWKSFGMFIYELNKNRDVVSPEMASKIRTLTADAKTDQEKIEILYKYLQDNMRYVSVQLGIGGWQTFDAKYVEKNKYGDCKALSNFMKSMLKEAGINAYPTLIYSSRRSKVEISEEFTFSGFANHVILNVPSEDMWLECTSNNYPPNYIGSRNQDRPVLMITEEGGKIIRTPALSLDENKASSTAKITINDQGAAVIDKQTEYIGPRHDYFRYLGDNLSQEEIEKDFSKRTQLPAFTIDKLEMTSDEKSPRCVVDYLVSVPRYSSKAGKRIFIPLNKLNPFKEVPKAIEKRKYPVKIKNQYKEEDSFVYYIPGDYELESIPNETINMESEFGKYQVDIIVTQGSITYKRLLEIHSVELPAERYDDLRNFYKEIAKADGMKAVLVKKKA